MSCWRLFIKVLWLRNRRKKSNPVKIKNTNSIHYEENTDEISLIILDECTSFLPVYKMKIKVLFRIPFSLFWVWQESCIIFHSYLKGLVEIRWSIFTDILNRIKRDCFQLDFLNLAITKRLPEISIITLDRPMIVLKNVSFINKSPHFHLLHLWAMPLLSFLMFCHCVLPNASNASIS